MQILELHLNSKQLDKQFTFYKERLQMEVEWIDEDRFQVLSQENVLVFKRSASDEFYHFCFLIPTGALESAMDYLKSRSIDLLEKNGEKIIHFDSGRSCYFNDMDENVVEFIERPLTGYQQKKEFNIKDVIKVNEIGLPVSKPHEKAVELMDALEIEPLDAGSFSEIFCWLGDHHGVVIVVKKGRNWLPTDRPAVSNAFTLSYAEGTKRARVRFDKEKWSLLD